MLRARKLHEMFWVAFFLCAAPCLPCYGQDAVKADNFGQGLFRLPSHAYFQAFRMAMPLRAPEELAKGRWETGFSATAANDWAFEENEHEIDAEAFHGTLWVARGFSDGFRLEVATDEQRIWGGFLDPVIEGFHNTLGISQNQRDKSPTGEVKVWTRWNRNGPLLYSEDKAGVLSRSTTVTLEHLVTRGDDFWPAVSWSVAGSLDWRDPALTERHAPFDAGLCVSFSKRIGPIYAYLAPGFAWYGADWVQDVRLKTVQFSGIGGVEWPFSPDASLVFQYLATEKAPANLPGFPRISHEVALGVKARLFSRVRLEAAVLENVLTYSNSPDFGLHLGVSGVF